MSDVVSYNQDASGENPANFIVREPHVIAEINALTNDVLVPNFPPFFPKDFAIETLDPSGTYSPLESGVDFELVLPYYGFEKETGKFIYGGSKLHRKPTSPMIYVTYRTLGGPHVGNRNKVLVALAEYVWNPRIIQWDQVTDVQETFPPNQHEQDLVTLKGWNVVEEKLITIIEKMGIAQEPTLLFQQQVIAMLASNEGLRREVQSLKSDVFDLNRRLSAVERRI